LCVGVGGGGEGGWGVHKVTIHSKVLTACVWIT